jgi:DNA-binding response OmpR family regulator
VALSTPEERAVRYVLPAAQRLADSGFVHRSLALKRMKTNSMARVLLVEDDLNLATAIAQLLPSHYEVSVAYDGQQALAEAMRFLPDTVLLDIGLPMLDGFDVARRLRAIYGSGVRLVAYTARSDITRMQLDDAGFDDILTKPASIDQISDAITSREPGRSIA